jgi:hypothetical protein
MVGNDFLARRLFLVTEKAEFYTMLLTKKNGNKNLKFIIADKVDYLT